MKIRNTRKKQAIKAIKRSALVCAVFASFSITAQDEGLFDNDISIEQSPSTAWFVGSNSREGGSLKVRIAGPNGTTVLEQQSLDGVIEWVLPSGLQDGTYSFDAWFTPSEAQGMTDELRRELLLDGPLPLEYQTRYNSGQLLIKDGAIEVNKDPDGDGDQANSSDHGRFFRPIASAVVDFLFPSAHAVPCASPCNVSSIATAELQIVSDSDATTGGPWDWEFEVDSSNGQIRLGELNGVDEPFKINWTAPVNSFFVSSIGYLGLGTATPADTIHIVNSNTPGIRLDDGGTGDWTIEEFSDNLEFTYNESGGGVFFTINSDGTVDGFGLDGSITAAAGQSDTFFYNAATGTSNPARMFWAHSPGFPTWGIQYADAEDEMYFQTSDADTSRFVTFDFSSREVGIGRGMVEPNAALHVFSENNTAEIRVEDTGTLDGQTMFNLVNQGHPKFRLQDASQPDVRWEFRTVGAGSGEGFSINKIGSGALEFFVRAGGNAEFAGNVIANGVVLSSSKTLKTAFRAIDEIDILDKVADLDILQWRYKNEAASVAHIGPMAEEFMQVFGMGDGKTLNMIDTTGIAFAAIQGLREEVRVRDDKIAALEAQNNGVQKEIAELRQLIEELR